MWTRMDLKMRGKMAFKRNYWPSVVVALVMAIIVGALSRGVNSNTDYEDYTYYGSDAEAVSAAIFALIFAAIAGIVMIVIGLLKIFLGNVLLIGGSRFFIENQTGAPSAGMLGYGFKSGKYGNLVWIMFLKDLFEFLWTLLFVVPGIIKHYEYLMIPYILAENPGMSRQEAFMISKRMMMGQKWNVFVMDLSFIGWRILEGITFGIVGVFYVEPYYQATYAELYAVNRMMAYQNGYIR